MFSYYNAPAPRAPRTKRSFQQDRMKKAEARAHAKNARGYLLKDAFLMRNKRVLPNFDYISVNILANCPVLGWIGTDSCK